jgi:phosphoribosyl 1,2-cyclic phosphodiesterase
MFVQSFGSGSSGNALLIQSRVGSVLVDCGLSPRVLSRAVAARNLRLSDLDGVLLTHEHDDHVRGLAAVRSAGRPLYATTGTATALGLPLEQCRQLKCGESIEVAGLSISTFATSHDAAESCGYSICDGTTRVSILTDLGEADENCAEFIARSHLIVIEANHDLPMLRSGPYPDHLKRRVLSSRGHLSNADCGKFLSRCLASTTDARTIWLAHLSATNNRPALAVRTVEQALANLRLRHAVVALPRREAGPLWQPGLRTGVAQLSMFD